MATKYLDPRNSQSRHAWKDGKKDGELLATPARMANIASICNEIDPKIRRRLVGALNIAGFDTMNDIPGFAIPVLLFGLTQHESKPFGYHPAFAQPDAYLKGIIDQTLDVETRLDMAKIMLKHPERPYVEWAKLSVAQAGFTDTQIASLGLAPVAPATPVNAIDPTELLRQTATELGLNPDAFVLAKTQGVSYADALILLDPPALVVETQPTVASKGKSAK